jgi:hypothetical protein
LIDQNRPVALFAIFGQPAHGVQLLLKRLLVDMGPETAVTPITLATQALPNNPDAIWRQIAHKVGLGQTHFQFPLSEDDKQTIAAGVCNQLQTRHVILFLEGVTDQLMPLLIQHFWGAMAQLVTEWRAQKSAGSDKKLFAFLVDVQGKVSEGVLAALPPTALPLVALPPLTPFTRQNLEDWLVDLIPHECDLPFRQFAFRPEAADEVLQRSQGIPDLALEYICTRCGYDYYGAFTTWLNP